MIDADSISGTIRKHPERLGRKIGEILYQEDYITSDDKAVISSVLDRVPRRNTFVHGDFHPGNILVRENELILIDVGDSGIDHPINEAYDAKKARILRLMDSLREVAEAMKPIDGI